MCQIVRAQLIVVWSLSTGSANKLTGFEYVPGYAQKCTDHGQDAVFCALRHQPKKWDGAFARERRIAS